MQITTQAATVTPVPTTGSGSKNARITTSFLSRNPQSQLAAAVGNIVIALTDNAAFPTPDPTLAAVTAALDAYVAKLNLAAAGGRLATAQLADARTALIGVMRSLALDVQKTSDGDRTMLVSTGFPLVKDRATVGPLPAPSGLRLQRGGNTGQLIARCRGSRNVNAYQWRYATAQAPAAWTETGTTTQARCLLKGLVPGTQYLAQVSAVGPNGESDWSNSVAMFAT